MKHFNNLKMEYITIEEGEALCLDCKGVGFIFGGGPRRNCYMCEGEGKIDLIQKLFHVNRDEIPGWKPTLISPPAVKNIVIPRTKKIE